LLILIVIRILRGFGKEIGLPFNSVFEPPLLVGRVVGLLFFDGVSNKLLDFSPAPVALVMG